MSNKLNPTDPDTINTEVKKAVADLEATFGPGWRKVIAVVRRAATLTVDETWQLAAAWTAAQYAAGAYALDAAYTAARAAGGSTWVDAALDAAEASAGDAASPAARAAAGAVAVADLVGQHRLIQDHIDTLMSPWVNVLGEGWSEGMLP